MQDTVQTGDEGWSDLYALRCKAHAIYNRIDRATKKILAGGEVPNLRDLETEYDYLQMLIRQRAATEDLEKARYIKTLPEMTREWYLANSARFINAMLAQGYKGKIYKGKSGSVKGNPTWATGGIW